MDLNIPKRKLVTNPLEDPARLTTRERSNLDLILADREGFKLIVSAYRSKHINADFILRNDIFNRVIDNIVKLKRENEVKSIYDLSAATKDGYHASFNNLIRNGSKNDIFRIEELATKKNSYRQYKAALNNFIEKQYEASIDLKKKYLLELLTAINTILQKPYLLPGITLNRKKPELALARKYDRKNEINDLPIDWQDVIFKNASEKMKPVLATLEATGCRPEELEKGIFMKRHGNDIYIRIQNAKISGYRDIRVQTNTLSSKFLMNYIDQQKQDVIEIRKDKTTLSQYFRDKRKYMSEDFKSITPYYYRYQKATDLMKLCEKRLIDESVVSMALGHLDKKTKLNYIANTENKVVSSKVVFAVLKKV